MKTRKIPMRTCVISHEKAPKQDLIRIVRTPSGEIVIDTTGKTNGHGAYLKKDLQIFEQAKKSKALDHHLGVNIPDEIFEELKNYIK